METKGPRYNFNKKVKIEKLKNEESILLTLQKHVTVLLLHFRARAEIM